MNALHDWIASASAWWWPRLADHLWQATVFAIVVVLASLLLKRGPARLRHTLWLLASAKFILPAALFAFITPTIGLDSLWFSLTGNKPETGVVLRGIAEPITSLTDNNSFIVSTVYSSPNEFYFVLTAIWWAGCAVLILSWKSGRNRYRRALKLARELRSGREWLALERARSLLGLKRNVGLMLSSQQVEPGVFRIWKPVILLPDSIADHLDDDELLAVMLHELVHVERRDNLTGRVQLALTGLFWFHPLVWFISRRLFDEREQACDEKVLELYGTPETYAASILKVVRFSFGWNVAGVTGAGSGSNLRRRIDNIMATGSERRRAGIALRILISAALGIALVAIVAAATHKPNADNPANATGRYEVDGNSVNVSVNQSRGGSQDQVTPPQPPSAPQPPAPPQGESPEQPTPANPEQPPSPPAAPNRAAPAQPASPPPPPAAEVPPTPPARPSGQDRKKQSKGKLIEAPKPIYPEEAKAKGVEGEVTVEIVIGDEGNVISARPTSGPELLQGAAKDAAMKARFEPTLVDGKPVKVSGAMTYNFVLDEKEKKQ